MKRRKFAANVICAAVLSACGAPAPSQVPAPRADVPSQANANEPQITFEGNSVISSAEILAAIRKARADDVAAEIISYVDLEDSLKADVVHATELYADRGMIDADLRITSYRPGSYGDPPVATMVIKEGSRYRIGALSIEERGAEDEPIAPAITGPLIHYLRQKPGDFFSRHIIREDLAKLLTAYHDKGYQNAELDPQTELDPRARTVNLSIAIRKKALVTIDRVEVRGAHLVAPEKSRAALAVHDGDLYGETNIQRTRANLLALGFSKVDVIITPQQNAQRVAVMFDVTEPNPNAIPTAPVACPKAIDVAALVERHARAFGNEAQVLAALPRTFTGVIDANAQPGASALYLAPTTYRLESELWGADAQRVLIASGIDEKGAWVLGASGALAKLDGAEKAGQVFFGALFRRQYLHAASLLTEKDAYCTQVNGRARITLSFGGAGPAPETALTFDEGTAALVEYEYTANRGRRAHGTISEWSAPDATGVRWPTWVTTPESTIHGVGFTANRAGAACVRESGASCLARVEPRMQVTWPKGGVVTVPAEIEANEVMLRVALGDKETWAILDSGASFTAIDSTRPLGAERRSLLVLRANGSTQKLTFGLSEAETLRVGKGLVFTKLPVATFPMPVLDSAGVHRPEMLLGLGIFQSGVVRIDYAKSEVTFAQNAALLPHHPSDSAVAIDADADMITTTAARIAGKSGVFQIDTGSGDVVDLDEQWAQENGLPGAHPIVQGKALTGAGTLATVLTMFRAPTSELGPARMTDNLAVIDVGAPPLGVAGRIGNGLLSRCAAVVFDVNAGTLSFEGPCTRTEPETKIGWHLERRDDSRIPDRPWVVAALLPGTSVDRAGIKIGDRILSVEGKPALLDRKSFRDPITGPAGKTVKVVIRRDGSDLTLPVVLEEILRRVQVQAPGKINR